LKFYGWELSFKDIVNKVREGELSTYEKQGFLFVAIQFSIGVVSFLISTFSFIVYILINPENELDAETAFVSISLFNIIRFPLMILPAVITGLIQVNVATQRIKGYLLKDEVDNLAITHNYDKEKAVSFEDVDLSWDEETSTLKNLNFQVKKNELIAGN
jgi:ATP-binding cassette, subfamily C (CFTR/MRP), member 1